jgi:carboxymethylenebutenolidase
MDAGLRPGLIGDIRTQRSRSMKHIGTIAAAVILAAGPAAAQTATPDAHAGHAAPASAAQASEKRTGNEPLPAGEDDAKAALEASSRHGEWVDVPTTGGTPLRAWIVYPERKDKAGVVIVIQEIFGLTDWIRAVADQLARDGFIAIAPDLLTGRGPNNGNTDAFASRDDVVKAVRGLDPATVRAQLDAVRQYGMKLPASNGKTGTVGFCWGGGVSFRYAGEQPGLNAAVVYYGTSPEADVLQKIKAPVLGLYGGDDARVNATIEPAETALKAQGTTYEHHVYDGAGHGFLRAQNGRENANRKATEEAWPRTVAFLREHLK